MVVNRTHLVVSDKSGNEHEERAMWKVKVCDKSVNNTNGYSRIDVVIGVCGHYRSIRTSSREWNN